MAFELLQETKEIQALMSGMGQRYQYDDQLPASTRKEKEPPWKNKKWEKKG